jgi:osomolarity two-component system response regulator SSK1
VPDPSPSSSLAPSSDHASSVPASSKSTPSPKTTKSLLSPETSPATDYFGGAATHTTSAPAMLHRKIWVKRPNASATLVQIREDDLVDDVRDMILKKYANSLGRSFDAPDVTLKIVPRDAVKGQDRTLGPEEEMCRTLDHYFPGGQKVNEALVIDVPKPRTPKPSPRAPSYHYHHDDGTHTQTEYFPPMPIVHPSPGGIQETRMQLPHAPHSIAVLSHGHIAPLPSPGGTRRQPHRISRPQYPRNNTASPNTLGGIPSSATTARPLGRPRHDSSASDAKNSATSNNPIPTPPALISSNTQQPQVSNPPTPRVASPQPILPIKKKGGKKNGKQALDGPSLPGGLLDGSVPPINVLIVEDNMINLRVLGAFMQRLKVRWQQAVNGKEAVTKWKAGGFHLVLMDIQLPVMNGLEATKEIRRLERVNRIGVFSSGSSEAPNTQLGQDGSRPEEPQDDDKLGDKGLFKSPVIIVALTASSLQSDRHEALAAGCNDFLTKVR